MSNLCVERLNLNIVNALADFGINLEDEQLLNREQLSRLSNLTELLEMMLMDLSLDSAMRQQIGMVLELYRRPFQ